MAWQDPKYWPFGLYVCHQCKEQKNSSKDFATHPSFANGGLCHKCYEPIEKERIAAAIAKRQAIKKARVDRKNKAHSSMMGKASAKAKKERIKLATALGLEPSAEKQFVGKTFDRQQVAKLKEEIKEQVEELTQEELIKREMASRELARRSLLHFIERQVPTYVPGWVHEDICRRLEKFMDDVEHRRSPRLMISMPPRHGKSEIASTQFPAWVLGHHPEWEFISTSYSLDLPIGFSRKIRAALQESKYQAMFPGTQLSKDSQSAEGWRTTAGGGFRAAGVGGGITGMGAHILVVDDPVKDQEEADSETARERVWAWYGSTAYTRLAPGGGVLVIQTRWSDDDLSGRLERTMYEGLKELKEVEALLAEIRSRPSHPEHVAELAAAEQRAKTLSASIDRWVIVKYPAIATDDELYIAKTGEILTVADMRMRVGGQVALIPPAPEPIPPTLSKTFRRIRAKGEALHPERFPLALLLKYQRTLQPRHWSALYQQNPVPDEGMFFTKDMLRFRPSLPDARDMYRFAAWDLAVGQKSSSDWTVGIVGALDWDDNLWILDMFRGRWTTLQIAERILEAHMRYDLQQTGIEKGQLELAVMPQLQKLMSERSMYISLAEGEEALRPITDKVMRARPLQGRMQQGKVIFPADQPWVDLISAEMLRFPTGVHDDIVDALAWLVRMVMGKQPPPNPMDKVRGTSFVSWKERLVEMLHEGEKSFMAR